MLAPTLLEQTARQAFVKLQKCWGARRFEPMRPLMMPDLFAEHCKLLAGMVRQHEINRIENLNVERIDIVGLQYTRDPQQRSFTALITARARDYYVDDRTGRFLRGDTSPSEFQEFWIFQRHGGAWLLRENEQSREAHALESEDYVEGLRAGQPEEDGGGKA